MGAIGSDEGEPVDNGLILLAQRDEYGKANTIVISAEDFRHLLSLLEPKG